MDLLRRLALTFLLVLGPSCDPLVDARYRGEPVFSFEGQLVAFDGLAEQDHEFRTTLMWLTDLSADPSTQGPRLASAVEQRSASVEVRFPSGFRLDLFAPPEQTMLVPGTGLGVALVVVYEDRDDNDRLTPSASPSELVGGAPYEALVYARDAAAARLAPFDDPIAAGFQLVRIPLSCGSQELTACTTPLGAACGQDSDCGPEGLCLRELDGVVWPGGACALRDETVTCTPPEEAGLYATFDGDLLIIVGCIEQQDCRAGYRCDDDYFGCVPDTAPGAKVPFSQRAAVATCAVELGARCIGDADCGLGQCLVRSNGESFAGGYCALPIPANEPLACEPAKGRPIPWDYRDDGSDTHWFRSCTTDAECRVEDGYACDVWLEVCLPTSPVALELGPGYVPSAVCYGTLSPSVTR